MSLEKPGAYPYTRGINADAGVWTMGQYGGFGTPAETNARFKMLLDQGLTGFSVALDLPTQLGLDSMIHFHLVKLVAWALQSIHLLTLKY
jgi:methylmalonyl-CoA mutase N-terminal domain/subunit